MALKTLISKIKSARRHAKKVKPERSFFIHSFQKLKRYFKKRLEALQNQINKRSKKEIMLYQKLFFWCGCFLVGICLAILGYEYLASPDIKLAPLNLEERCLSLEQQVDNFIGEANYCQTSDDCLVWEPQELICPFGCYLLINQKTNTNNRAIQKSITAGLKKYQKSCSLCLYKCPVRPQKTDLICLNNKCLDRRFYTQPASVLPQGEKAFYGPSPNELPNAKNTESAIIYSIFKDNLRNFQKIIPINQNQNILNQETAAELATAACGSSPQGQATFSSELSIKQRKNLESLIGTEFDWLIALQPTRGVTTAFINQEKLAVVCLSTYEQ